MPILGTDRLHILLVEDNPGDVRLIRHYLGTTVAEQRGQRPGLLNADTLGSGLDHLEQGTFDLVLLDLGLPDSSGLETLMQVLETAPNLPIVVLTGSDDNEMAVRAVKKGAQDYIVKGTIDGELLGRSLRYALERKRSERELQRQNERLQSFAGVVSHDLRNPINIVAGRIQVARKERDTDNLTRAAEALERMDTLVDDVLSLAQQGATIGEESIVDLTTLVDRAWEIVRTEDAALRGSPSLGRIEADPGRLSELLENLLSNAIRHGGEAVIVEVGRLTEQPGFYIEDDGPGVPVEERDEIFEAGFTTNRNGTGFGLSIVKSIVDAQEWNITVTSGTTGGARFEVGGVEYISDK